MNCRQEKYTPSKFAGLKHPSTFETQGQVRFLLNYFLLHSRDFLLPKYPYNNFTIKIICTTQQHKKLINLKIQHSMPFQF